MASLELKKEIQEALKNTTLSRTLGNFCAAYPAKRAKSYEGVDFEGTREKIREVMRYSSRRYFLKHPVTTLSHGMALLRKRKEERKKESQKA